MMVHDGCKVLWVPGMAGLGSRHREAGHGSTATLQVCTGIPPLPRYGIPYAPHGLPHGLSTPPCGSSLGQRYAPSTSTSPGPKAQIISLALALTLVLTPNPYPLPSPSP